MRGTDDEIYTHEQILQLERKDIESNTPRQAGAPWIGLCLSGGGVRSACFCLGVLQTLARMSLLPSIDYVSTVSGGSYIGSWLAAWIKRQSLDEVSKSLSSDREPQPVRHLRMHSTYLTKNVAGLHGGLFWSVTYVSQLILLWSLLVLTAWSGLLLPAIYANWQEYAVAEYSALAIFASIVISLVNIFVALDFPAFGGGLPSHLFFIGVPGSLGFVGYCASLSFLSANRQPTLTAQSVAASTFILTGLFCCFFSASPDRRQNRGRLLLLVCLSSLSVYAIFALSAIAPSSFFHGSAFVEAALPSVLSICVYSTFYFALRGFSDSTLQGRDWLHVSGVMTVIVSTLMFVGHLALRSTFLKALTPTSCLLAMGSLLILTRILNINHLSLHTVYRHRLVGAYLAASNERREPHPLTGLDKRDDMPVSELPWRPFQIFNIAASGLEGQRATEAFSVSKLFSGNRILGYRPTARYAGGISTGSAIAISGAAIDPSMHRAPKIGQVLMSALNARLGVWYPSPEKSAGRAWTKRRIRPFLLPLLREIIGIQVPSKTCLRLSDGGHFENLGLYELLARKLDLVIVVDASWDPALTFSGLGEAVQKARCDMGLRIRFTDEGNRGWRLGFITYIDGSEGILICLKPIKDRGEPAEVRSYAKSHKEFPHHPTTNQFFDEWQFESYRALGGYSSALAMGEIAQELKGTEIGNSERVAALLIEGFHHLCR